MSALDLFASALGAFILITIILLPYYLKVDKDVTKENLQIKKALHECNKKIRDIDKIKSKLKEVESKNKKLKKEIENAISFALLGITTKAKSFVILIDMSGSMKSYKSIIIETFNKIVEPMKDDIKIQIIGFQGDGSSSQLHNWNNPINLKMMDSANKNNSKNYVKLLSNKFGGGTPTHKALLEALKYNSEAILLLTDGAPNKNPNDIISDITQKNGLKKEINCVAIGDYRSNPILVEFLEILAKQNRGGFIGVSN